MGWVAMSERDVQRIRVLCTRITFLMQELANEDIAMIVVTDEIGFASVADRVFFVDQGGFVE